MKKRSRFLIIFIIVFILGLSYVYKDNFKKSLVIDSGIKDLDKESKLDYINNHKGKYPRALLEALSKNGDMLDFVYEYPKYKGEVLSNSLDPQVKGKFPLLLQYDKRWGYGIYGDDILALTGCGPTVITMAYAGLTGKSDLTPYEVSQIAYDNGYYDSGTTWDFMREGVELLGLKGREIPLSEEAMITSVNNNMPIVLSMRPGDFTSSGHFILVTNYQDGMFKVNDPNSQKRSNKPWSYDTLKGQIKNLWSISLK